MQGVQGNEGSKKEIDPDPKEDLDLKLWQHNVCST